MAKIAERAVSDGVRDIVCDIYVIREKLNIGQLKNEKFKPILKSTLRFINIR